jgi:hypothetical protein
MNGAVGPFAGRHEVVRAFAIVDVAALDAALELAQSWPDPNGIVEVRPVWPNDEGGEE